MTPLETISLVGNIITFVQFSAEIVSKARDIYHSADATTETINLDIVTTDLNNLASRLSSATGPAEDRELVDLCLKCSNTAKRLQDALQKLKLQGPRTTLKAFRKAFRSIWSAKDIEALEKTLCSYRDELNLRILVDLRLDWR